MLGTVINSVVALVSHHPKINVDSKFTSIYNFLIYLIKRIDCLCFAYALSML